MPAHRPLLPTPARSPSPLSWMLLPLIAAAGCAEGGDEDRTTGDVQLAAQHHLFGYRALGAFSAYPIDAAEVFPDEGLLTMFDDETYTVTRGTTTSPADAYALEGTGELAMLVSGGGREPNVVFRGAYGLSGATNAFFFTDRIVNSSSPSVGLFYGLRLVPGVADLSGQWHVVSLHNVFEQTTVQDPRFVARTAYGTIIVGSGAAGAQLPITGAGQESTTATLIFDGTLQALNDGEANLELGYLPSGSSTVDTRTFQAASNGELLFAVDRDESDGEAGALFAVRRRTSPVDTSAVAGEYFVGALTSFVNPRNPGTDGAFGRMELTAQGAFRLEMVGANGSDFTYQGSWAARSGAGAEGVLDFAVSGTDETWVGAVDQGYDTLILADTTIELRSNNNPELNLFVGIRPVRTN